MSGFSFSFSLTVGNLSNQYSGLEDMYVKQHGWYSCN